MTTRSRLGRRIAIAEPEAPDIDAALMRLRTVLLSGSFTNGAEVEQLEHEAAKALGVAHCVAVSSCTSGLMLVEKCLNLPGEVITPSFTFFATGHGLLWNGLRPRFADIDAQTVQIDPKVLPGRSGLRRARFWPCICLVVRRRLLSWRLSRGAAACR